MSDIADPRYEDPAFIAPGFGGTWLAAGEEGSVLPRTPSGHINNCAIANGEPEDECQMCGGTCPDRDRLLHHSRTQIGYRDANEQHVYVERRREPFRAPLVGEPAQGTGYRDTALRSLEQDKQAAIERAKPKAADLGSWAEQGPTEQPKSEQDKQREADLYALDLVVDHDDPTADELEAFSDMRDRLQRGRYPLSEKQRAWLHKVCARVGIDPNPEPKAPPRRRIR